MEPRLFHRFTAEPDSGTVLVGEVSYVSDEAADNNFYGDSASHPRFPGIEEDEAPLHLLCNDYQEYI
jgi:D-lyxose ketol-isomerase